MFSANPEPRSTENHWSVQPNPSANRPEGSFNLGIIFPEVGTHRKLASISRLAQAVLNGLAEFLAEGDGRADVASAGITAIPRRVNADDIARRLVNDTCTRISRLRIDGVRKCRRAFVNTRYVTGCGLLSAGVRRPFAVGSIARDPHKGILMGWIKRNLKKALAPSRQLARDRIRSQSDNSPIPAVSTVGTTKDLLDRIPIFFGRGNWLPFFSRHRNIELGVSEERTTVASADHAVHSNQSARAAEITW